MTNLFGYNKKNRISICYPSIPSAIRPVLYSERNPVPLLTELLDIPLLYSFRALDVASEVLAESDSEQEM